MSRDPLLHIHASPGDVCVACGDPDDDDHDFVTDTGYWNQQKRNCSPSKIIGLTYQVTGRADPRTSALKTERKASRKKVRDPR